MPSRVPQGELTKKGPEERLGRDAVWDLARTNDLVQIHFARLLRKYGLTSSQYNILRILRGAGKPMPCLEIAERTMTVVPGITGLIDRLEKQGLVRRARCAKDRRVVYISITDDAEQRLVQLDGPVTELHRAVLGHLTRAEMKELVRLLEKVRESLVATN